MKRDVMLHKKRRGAVKGKFGYEKLYITGDLVKENFIEKTNFFNG
ncbi:hypothetical protein [Paenibacillus sp. Marseille-Q9583]